MPTNGAATARPILTVEDVPAHRAVPGRQSATITATPPMPINAGGAIVYGDCTNDVIYYPTAIEVWNAWNTVYTITSSATGSVATMATLYAIQQQLNAAANEAIMTDNTWLAWNIQQAAATITTTTAATTITVHNPWDTTWNNWVQVHDYEAADRETRVRRQVASGKQPSAEQLEQWRQEEIRQREANEKRLKDEIAAKDKAITLLKSCLTRQQIEEYEQKKHFHLHVGGKVYRIEQGSHGNVKLVDKDGKVKRSFCVQPRGIPDGDVMLAQKLMLETDEKGFYERSNVTEYDDKGQHLGTFHGARAAELLQRPQQAG